MKFQVLQIVQKMDKKFLRMFNVARYQQWKDFGKFDITKDRQDQLQAMITERVACSPVPDVALAYMFHNWLITNDGYLFGYEKAPLPQPSMEQLWLAFVMKSLYSKIWNGTKWVASC